MEAERDGPPHPTIRGSPSLAGGALWLSGFGLLMTVPNMVPVGYLSGPVVGMACGAALLGAAAVRVLLAAPGRPALRALGLACLIVSFVIMLFGLAAVAVVGDEDVVWNAVDPETAGWWGVAAFMVSLAVVTAFAAPRRLSWLSLAWAGAVLGAGGQAIAFAPYSFGTMVTGSTAPVAVIVFGAAWMAIGIVLTWEGGSPPQVVGRPSHTACPDQRFA